MQSTLDPPPQTAVDGYIDIVTDKGFLTIAAEIYGNWAIHKNGSRWAVTHVGTGLAVATLWRKEAALWMLKNLPPLPEKTADLGKWRQHLTELVDVAESLGMGVESRFAELTDLLTPDVRQRLSRVLDLLDSLECERDEDEGADD